MAADLQVLTEIVLGLARDVVQVKEILARIDGRSSPSW
jgi:hypothetical protein